MGKQKYILELCSEDATNSWQFWQSQPKTETECSEIVNAITELVQNGLIFPTTSEHIKDQSYKAVPLDISRLTKEVRNSMQSSGPSEGSLYWFVATVTGKERDILNRSVTQH